MVLTRRLNKPTGRNIDANGDGEVGRLQLIKYIERECEMERNDFIKKEQFYHNFRHVGQLSLNPKSLIISLRIQFLTQI